MKAILIDKEALEELKKLYAECPEGGMIDFKGEVLIKDYAKYLIEYLESKLK